MEISEQTTSTQIDYYLFLDGQQAGPYSGSQIREMVDGGALVPDTLVWHEGLSDWKTLAELWSLTSRNPQGGSQPVANEKSENSGRARNRSRLPYIGFACFLIVACSVGWWISKTESNTQATSKPKPTEYITLVGATPDSKIEPLIYRSAEELRSIFGKEDVSKALSQDGRVKAILWKNVSPSLLGLQLSAPTTFNVEAQTFADEAFLITFKQMNGIARDVIRPIDDSVAFALVRIVVGPHERHQWQKAANRKSRSDQYFLPGKGMHLLYGSINMGGGITGAPEFAVEVTVFSQMTIDGVLSSLPSWIDDGIGSKLTN